MRDGDSRNKQLALSRPLSLSLKAMQVEEQNKQRLSRGVREEESFFLSPSSQRVREGEGERERGEREGPRKEPVYGRKQPASNRYNLAVD